MNGKIEEYVKDIEKTCGEKEEYVVMLKYGKQREAAQKIISKGNVTSTVAGTLIKVKYKDKEISIVGNKVLFKNVQSMEEIKSLINELLG